MQKTKAQMIRELRRIKPETVKGMWKWKIADVREIYDYAMDCQAKAIVESVIAGTHKEKSK